MKKINYLFLIAALAAGLHAARATTVIPPTFDELVAQAEVIFQGNVTDVRSQWVGEGAQRHIVSYVTFNVADAVKGSPGESYTIRMFGGTVGEDTMGISDAPTFKVGDEDVLFVENNGTQLVPLVGMMHGRFQVQQNESGLEIVKDDVGEPVKNVAKLGRPANAIAAAATEPDMTAADFKAAVRSKLQSAQ
jgi:hypothetical protein